MTLANLTSLTPCPPFSLLSLPMCLTSLTFLHDAAHRNTVEGLHEDLKKRCRHVDVLPWGPSTRGKVLEGSNSAANRRDLEVLVVPKRDEPACDDAAECEEDLEHNREQDVRADLRGLWTDQIRSRHRGGTQSLVSQCTATAQAPLRLFRPTVHGIVNRHAANPTSEATLVRTVHAFELDTVAPDIDHVEDHL